MEFKQVKANLKKDFTGFKKIKVAILADSATQYLAQAIRGVGYEKKLDIEIWEADYDSVDITVRDEGSELYRFKPDFVFLFLSSQKLKKKFYKTGSDINFADDQVIYLKEVVKNISSHIKTNFLLFNFPDVLDSVFGNFAGKVNSSFSYQVKKLNLELMNWML